MRVNDGTHEINVFRPQPARLAQPQPDQRAEQHREPDALRNRSYSSQTCIPGAISVIW
jgi:hypothetical protein